MIRVNCLHCGRDFDVPLSHCGGVVCCPHRNCGRDMVIPPVAMPIQGLLLTERCYKCSKAIPEGQVHRRKMQVSTTDPSDNSSGGVSTYALVSLCRCCCEELDEEEEWYWESVRDIILYVVLGILLVGIIAFSHFVVLA